MAGAATASCSSAHELQIYAERVQPAPSPWRLTLLSLSRRSNLMSSRCILTRALQIFTHNASWSIYSFPCLWMLLLHVMFASCAVDQTHTDARITESGSTVPLCRHALLLVSGCCSVLSWHHVSLIKCILTHALTESWATVALLIGTLVPLCLHAGALSAGVHGWAVSKTPLPNAGGFSDQLLFMSERMILQYA